MGGTSPLQGKRSEVSELSLPQCSITHWHDAQCKGHNKRKSKQFRLETEQRGYVILFISLFIYFILHICLCEVLLLTIFLLACHCVWVYVCESIRGETLSVLSMFILLMCSYFCMCMQPTNNLKGLVDLT